MGYNKINGRSQRSHFYPELLHEPKWLSVKESVLERDNYCCTECGSSSEPQVHHTFYYHKNTMPWEYPLESMVTLCRDCHDEYHENKDKEFKLIRIELNDLFPTSRNFTFVFSDGTKHQFSNHKCIDNYSKKLKKKKNK